MPLKDRVLEVLEKNKGKSVSGSEIAKSVGMTGSAVWKAVKALREEGYFICAVTNRGYCLSEENDFLSEQSIVPNLKTKPLAPQMILPKALHSSARNTEQRLFQKYKPTAGAEWAEAFTRQTAWVFT